MADPLIIACPVDTWVKVATNVTAGTIWINRKITASYMQTYRATGGTAPVDDDDSAAIAQPGQPISSLSGIDVYVKAKNVTGEVRMDL